MLEEIVDCLLMGDVAQYDKGVALACLVSLLFPSKHTNGEAKRWGWRWYGLKESKDEVWSVRNEMFRVMVDGIDRENSIFPNVGVTVFLNLSAR